MLNTHHRLTLVLGLVSGGMLGMSCLETTPLEECFDIAKEDGSDRIEVVPIGIKSGEECPKEGAREVKDGAREHADWCVAGAKLKNIACGPLEELAVSPGVCHYVAVYNKPIGGCPWP